MVNDLALLEFVSLAKADHDRERRSAGIAEPPRSLITVSDMPLADPYDPQRFEVKLEAGADLVMTQIAFDVEA